MRFRLHRGAWSGGGGVHKRNTLDDDELATNHGPRQILGSFCCVLHVGGSRQCTMCVCVSCDLRAGVFTRHCSNCDQFQWKFIGKWNYTPTAISVSISGRGGCLFIIVCVFNLRGRRRRQRRELHISDVIAIAAGGRSYSTHSWSRSAHTQHGTACMYANQ